MGKKEVSNLYDRHLIQTYAPEIVFDRGERVLCMG